MNSPFIESLLGDVIILVVLDTLVNNADKNSCVHRAQASDWLVHCLSQQSH